MTDQLGFDFGTRGPEPPAREIREDPGASRLGEALAAALGEPSSGVRRTWLVGRTRGHAREILRHVARLHGGWAGVDATSVRPIAAEVAVPLLVTSGRRLLDDFDVRARVDAAMDRTFRTGGWGRLGELSDRVGLRERIYGWVRALRMAGVTSDTLSRAPLRARRRREALARILMAYERGLEADGVCDVATLLTVAAEALTRDGARIPADPRILFLPGLPQRGLSGQLLRALEEHGAHHLEADPVIGVPVPAAITWRAGVPRTRGSFLHAPERAPEPGPGTDLEIEVFTAAGITEELREALRRVTARRVTWDQVEFATPDPMAYGSALHVVAERLGVPVTYGVGLPLARTRAGRAVELYFRWIEGGFPASELRTALEKGDLRPAARYQDVRPMTLARRFRWLRVGWGRRRYARLLSEALAAAPELPRGRHETEARWESRRRRVARELRALRSILRPVLAATPPVPHPTEGGGAAVSAADLARGLETFLRFVPAEHPVDESAAQTVRTVLGRARETLTRPTDYAWAAAALRRHLDVPVSAPRSEGRAPWGSDGGHLFLTDLTHAGYAGRRHTFIVGMDSTRFPGEGEEDPLLPDVDTTDLGRLLPTAAARLEQRRFELAALMARVRGAVTLSWSSWEPADARALSPAAAVLQAYRLRQADPTLTFADLHDHVGVPRGPLARSGALDGQDAWMRGLSEAGRLKRGGHLVRRAFPQLRRGLRAFDALDEAEATPWLGAIEPRDALDPRLNPTLALSASRLEALGTCPRRYLFQSVWRIRPPDDPVRDPDTWLDPLARGSLLHTVYERTLADARARSLDPADADVLGVALDVLETELHAARVAVPAPSRQVRLRQEAALREDVESFVTMVAERGAPWIALEHRFGLEDEPAVLLTVPGGQVRLRGVIDRVDDRSHGLVVVDYKTGRPYRYGGSAGVFDKGRRLQHVVYVAAAGRLYERPVAAMEYQFPTRRAENQVVRYPEVDLRLGREVIGHLLDAVRAGAFLPTSSPDDCTFCDYQTVCRVQVGEWEKESPFAEWAGRNAELEAFTFIQRARAVEEEGVALLPPPRLDRE